MLKVQKNTVSVKPNHVLKVIRVNKCNNFWENTYMLNRYYYHTIDEKISIYGFLNEESAKKCLEFLNVYKKFNLRYPNQEKTCNDLIIDDEPLVRMQQRCALCNVGLLGITDFKYKYTLNKFDTDYTAVNLLQNVYVNEENFIDNLEYIYNF